MYWILLVLFFLTSCSILPNEKRFEVDGYFQKYDEMHFGPGPVEEEKEETQSVLRWWQSHE